MFITKKAIPRRQLLQGIGAVLALPVLDAMWPTAARGQALSKARRVGFVYMPNGVARNDLRTDTLLDNQLNFWTPRESTSGMELSPILQPLAPVRENIVVLSGLSHLSAFALGDGNGDHSRGCTTWLSGVHPLKSEGRVRAAATLDQMLADQLGKETQLPSLELISSDVEAGIGNCENGYSCAYLNTISWRTETVPVPTENNPRVIFDRLFGDGRSGAERREGLKGNSSVLDAVQEATLKLRQSIGPSDRVRLTEYLDSIREVERRIQRAEAASATSLPEHLDRPPGVPPTFKEHAKLMYDLLALAYQADVTRCFTFMLGRELQQRTHPEVGVPENHHSLSHHGNNAQSIEKLRKINVLQMELFAEFVQKLKSTPDGDGNLLDQTLLMYGGGMSNPNEHNHIDLPTLFVGGQLKGNRHIKYEIKTPMSNVLLTMLGRFGMPSATFGDSNGILPQDPLPGMTVASR